MERNKNSAQTIDSEHQEILTKQISVNLTQSFSKTKTQQTLGTVRQNKTMRAKLVTRNCELNKNCG